MVETQKWRFCVDETQKCELSKKYIYQPLDLNYLITNM